MFRKSFFLSVFRECYQIPVKTVFAPVSPLAETEIAPEKRMYTEHRRHRH